MVASLLAVTNLGDELVELSMKTTAPARFWLALFLAMSL
jgi:hypothetical protein